MSGVFEEIKRRKVFRVSAMYAVFAWLLIQIGDTTFEPLGMPQGSLRILIIATIAGFPIAVALGWVFDWTSQGIVRTSSAKSKGNTATTKRSANYPLILGLIGAVLSVILSFAGYRAYDFYAKVQWAQNEAQPELARLIEKSDIFGAFDLANELEQAMGELPSLKPIWPMISTDVNFNSEPSGATISYRRYDDPQASWIPIGKTPIDNTLVPLAAAVWKIEKVGYQTRIFSRVPSRVKKDFKWQSDFILDLESETTSNLIAVEGGAFQTASLAGLPFGQAFELQRYYIDKTEVSNREYQEFVDAGGYRNSEYWTEPFTTNDAELSFDQAMQLFVDSTGRTGPSIWIGGRFPEGKGDYPVGGVSWFEAMAYAKYRGRNLPTMYHWATAALAESEIVAPLAPKLAAQSNLESEGPVPVGTTSGISSAGAFDMFGNVAEWVLNERENGQYYSLGLGWTDAAYNASIASSAPAWSRLAEQGLRLVSYPSGPPDDSLRASYYVKKFDFNSISSISDEAYRIAVSSYPKSLDSVESNETASTLANGYSALRVEISYPYSDEILPLYLLIPENTPPPYQALVWFGGMNALHHKDNSTLFDLDMRMVNFLRQSGRMLVLPVWSHTFERNDGSALQKFHSDKSTELRNDWRRDLTYALDYLETRDDVDAERIGYGGLSFGSNLAPYLLHQQPRIKAAALWSGGLFSSNTLEATAWRKSITQRIKIPVLMINGQHDYVIPLENQTLLYETLGSDPDQKKHVVYDTGHIGWPIGKFVKENLDWWDTHLGPIQRK